MALTPKLTLKPTQTATLTPQMAQSLKLLELGSLDLLEELQTIVTDNPLLSLEAPESTDSDLGSSTDGAEADNLSYQNTWSGSSSQTFSGSDTPFYEMIADTSVTLRDHLSNQINMDFLDPHERFLGLHLIEFIDESGYFRGELSKIGTNLKIPLAQLQSIFSRLQKMDPPGIFARNLAECLKLQLEDRNLLTPALSTLVDNLDLFAQNQIQKIKKKCHYSDAQLEKAIKLIQELTPKPGSLFLPDPNTSIIPELILKRNPSETGWIIVLNPRTHPKILINHQYYSEIIVEATDKKAQKYIKENYTSARWLEKTLQQRYDTMIKVATEIVAQQSLFFERGVSALKPLKLSDIAAEVDLHESTVSRAVSQKFMATPLGTFELKYFFTTGLTSAFGEKDLSAESVRSRIKTLIEGEDKAKPLSDDQLVKILKGEGMGVARRTVAKYRDSLKIPSSFYRKAWKKGA